LQKDIANYIGTNPSTISREISRNGGAGYDARKANAKNHKQRKSAKAKTKKLLTDKNNRPRKRLNYLTPQEVFVKGKIAFQGRMHIGNDFINYLTHPIQRGKQQARALKEIPQVAFIQSPHVAVSVHPLGHAAALLSHI